MRLPWWSVFLLVGCTAEVSREFDYVVGPVDNTGATGPEWCALPGNAVAGAVTPPGLCVRQFAQVSEARVLAMAPNGDVFVSSPSLPTPGGTSGGRGAIVVLSDDDRNGVAEQHTFANELPDVHGLAFANGWLYFTRDEALWRTPYRAGQRAETPGARERLGMFPSLEARRWTHGVAVATDGTVYTTQGVYSALNCPDTPREGSVMRSMGTSLEPVSQGYRNPLYLRCHPSAGACLVAELGDDGGASFGAREKIILLRASTNYGFPCCSTTGAATPYNQERRYDCAMAAREEAQFPLNDTPFGLDWERGRWPAPFRGGVFVALHGSFYSNPQWAGSRVVFAAADAATHAPVGPWRDVLRGFAPGGSVLDRATDVAFSPDGRLFLADDQAGVVFWIAPIGLRAP